MERIYSTGNIVAANRDDILHKIAENIEVIGWELLGNRVSTNGDIIVKSVSNDENSLPVYVRIYRHYTELVKAAVCTYYSGGVFINRQTGKNSSYAPYNTGCVHCDANTHNNIILKGNRDILCLDVYRPSNNSYQSLLVFKIDNPIWGNETATIKEEITTGSDVTAKLGTGESNYFNLNKYYRLISPLGHVTKPKIIEIDTSNDTITFDSLPYTMVSGTKCGPLPFPWISAGIHNYNSNGIQFLTWDVGSRHTTGESNNSITVTSLFGTSVSNDVYNHEESVLTPVMFYDGSNGTLGYSSYLYYSSYGSRNDVVGVNKVYDGVVSTATNLEIFDNVKNWDEDELKGLFIIITSGEQEFTTREITLNTYNALTVDPPFQTTISGSETYTICEAFYRKISANCMGSNIFLKDI